MAIRRNHIESDEQLELFAPRKLTHDTIEPIRPDGGETLARTSSEDGARTGSEGTLASDASGGGGKDEGRNGRAADTVDEAGINGATSSRPSLGNGEREIHPASARRDLAVRRKRHHDE